MTPTEQFAVGLILISAFIFAVVAIIAVVERVPCVRRVADRAIHKIGGRWEDEE